MLTIFNTLVGLDNALAQRGGGEVFARRGVPPLVFQVQVTTRLLSATISAQLTAGVQRWYSIYAERVFASLPLSARLKAEGVVIISLGEKGTLSRW